jgi:hypothetical protein
MAQRPALLYDGPMPTRGSDAILAWRLVAFPLVASAVAMAAVSCTFLDPLGDLTRGLDGEAAVPGILCGSARCPLADGSVCCYQPEAGTSACTTESQCTGAPLACSDSTNCSDGEVCNYFFQSQITFSSCEVICTGSQLCDPDAAGSCDCASGTSSGTKCQPTGKIPSGYFACQ